MKKKVKKEEFQTIDYINNENNIYQKSIFINKIIFKKKK